MIPYLLFDFLFLLYSSSCCYSNLPVIGKKSNGDKGWFPVEYTEVVVDVEKQQQGNEVRCFVLFISIIIRHNVITFAGIEINNHKEVD